MRKRVVVFVLLICIIFSFCACDKTVQESSFSIRFIDVGQGDSALVECDGHYMLIDGGDISAGDKVYKVLEEQGIQKLDILAISHLHLDHIGGLIKVLTYASSIGVTLSNSDYVDKEAFRKFEHELLINGSKITIPTIGDTYELGSAIVEVIDVCAEEENDSLVLMITYGDTKFLFTGDIGTTAQARISDKYENELDESVDIDLIKMPHHGSYTGTLYRFLRTFMPEYAIISVGDGNTYGHPHRETLDLLDNDSWKFRVYRTDKDGDIVVKSNGQELSIETNK